MSCAHAMDEMEWRKGVYGEQIRDAIGSHAARQPSKKVSPAKHVALRGCFYTSSRPDAKLLWRVRPSRHLPWADLP
jgi:hypothetical protein